MQHRARTFCRRSICCARRGLSGLPRGPLRPSRERTPASCGRVEYSRMRRRTRVIQSKRAYFCAPLLTAPPRQSQLPNKAALSIAVFSILKSFREDFMPRLLSRDHLKSRKCIPGLFWTTGTCCRCYCCRWQFTRLVPLSPRRRYQSISELTRLHTEHQPT